jgi:hypothetical protein
MHGPTITTALPKRRYQIGEFIVTILGDIESSDSDRYRYILALVPEGKREPMLYLVVVEQRSAAGRYRLRLITPAQSEDFAEGDEWGDLDTFADHATEVVRKVMGLTDEMVIRLN